MKLIKVSGHSMAPALMDGDYVIMIKARSFRLGFIYVIDHSDLGRIIKRLDRVENERLIVSGDNSASAPSSIIAPVATSRVLGRARFAITKSGLKRL